MNPNQHPLINSPNKEKGIYLKGLILLSSSDGKIDPIETNFISFLKKHIATGNDVDFKVRSGVDLNLMEEIFNYLRSSESKYAFIMDCLFLMGCDGEIHNNEVHLLNTYMELMEIDETISKKIIKGTNFFLPSQHDGLIEYIKTNKLPFSTETANIYKKFFSSQDK